MCLKVSFASTTKKNKTNADLGKLHLVFHYVTVLATIFLAAASWNNPEFIYLSAIQYSLMVVFWVFSIYIEHNSIFEFRSHQGLLSLW